MKNIILIHRWLGVIACLAVFMFAGSGILHPVMSRMQPQPAQFAPPRVELPANALSLRAVLEQNHIDRFNAATVVQVSDAAVYRVQTNSSARYFRVDSGVEVDNGERVHAEFLARHFLGDSTSKIASLQEQRNFDDDYVFINRLLPAWRVEFVRDDGMRVYVDTAGNRLATLTDTKKRIFQTYFRTLHDFDFLEDHNMLRLTVMLLLLFSAFITAVAGVVMYVRLRRASQRLKNLSVRRWHRRLSLAIAIVTFSFTVSGIWHLLQSRREIMLPSTPQTDFFTQELGDTIASQPFVLLRVSEQVCYRQPATLKHETAHEHHHPEGMAHTSPAPLCLDTKSLQPIADADVKLAEQFARYYSHSEGAVQSAEMITKFGGEYGFINKRLPVWKIQFESDSTRWYIETSSGVLALHVDDSDAREGWVFSIFHKARFIGDAYKNLRDAFLMLAAFGCLTVATLGMILFVRQLRSTAKNR